MTTTVTDNDFARDVCRALSHANILASVDTLCYFVKLYSDHVDSVRKTAAVLEPFGYEFIGTVDGMTGFQRIPDRTVAGLTGAGDVEASNAA